MGRHGGLGCKAGENEGGVLGMIMDLLVRGVPSDAKDAR